MQSTQPLPESNTNTDKPTLGDSLDGMAAIRDLLRGKNPETAQNQRETVAKAPQSVNIDAELARESEQSPEGGAKVETPKKVAPKDLKTLAETLGVEVSELYNLELTDGTGKTHKLGALKDLAVQQDKVTAKELELSERETTESNNLLRQRQELEQLVGMIPREMLKPELIERIRSEREKYIAQEVDKLIDVIPEWKNQATLAADKSQMASFLKEYGIEPETLQGMVDHRFIKLIRDSWQRKARIDKAMAAVKETRDPPKGANRATGTPAKPAVTVSGNSDFAKASAIGQLLRR